MNQQELADKISQLKGIKPVPNMSGTFMNEVPFSKENIIHFVRPVAEDVVLKASSMNVPPERAVAHAARLLDFGTQHLANIQGELVTRIEPFESESPKFDTFLALGPSIANIVIGGSTFLKTRTSECYAINHIEFAGDETEAEAIVRKKHARLSDFARDITPVIFGRYHKQTGQRSAEYLAVATYESTVRDIEQMPRDGGVVEFENWERERVTLTNDRGNDILEATFAGQTKPLTVDAALKLMNELVYRGVEAAKKVW
ncbi:MAG: hypothetical protein ACOY0T_28925 [Myxococcota bacterium]